MKKTRLPRRLFLLLLVTFLILPVDSFAFQTKKINTSLHNKTIKEEKISQRLKSHFW